MLILTGVVLEIGDGKAKHVMLLSSPRAPGVHYKVDVDETTADRLKILFTAEAKAAATAEAAAQSAVDNDNDEDQPERDPFGRN